MIFTCSCRKFWQIIFSVVLLCGTAVCADALKLEKLGVPATAGKFKFYGRTGNTLWIRVRGSDRTGVLGVNLETRKTTWVDLAKYGSYSAVQVKTAGGKVYIYCGVSKSGFLCYDPASGSLEKVGSFVPKARYALDSFITDDGLVLVGSYPHTKVVWVDTKTKKSGCYGRMTTNPKQRYVRTVKMSANGIIYCSVGLHHQEIWAFNPKTGEKKQILPAEYSSKKGYPALFCGTDGRIYGRDYDGKRSFLCSPEGVKYVKKIPFKPVEKYYYKGDRYLYLEGSGNLVAVTSKGKVKKIKTDFKPIGPLLFSISPGEKSNIVIGTFTPAQVIIYDAAGKKTVKNLGRKSRGGTQVYSVLTLPQGRFISSYIGGYVDLLIPGRKKSKHVLSLAKNDYQERIFQLILGTDGNIYGPTMPFKGYHGGGIVKINPKTLKHEFFRNIIPLQTIRSIAANSDGLLFGGSSIAGGTGTRPKTKCAEIFLFDPRKGKVVWRGKPIKGAYRYRSVCKVADDLFFALADSNNMGIFFKPSERKVVARAKLPARKYATVLAGAAPAIKPAVYVLSDDKLLEITSAGEVRELLRSSVILAKFKNACHSTQAEWVSPEGILYLGSGPVLYRADLKTIAAKESGK